MARKNSSAQKVNSAGILPRIHSLFMGAFRRVSKGLAVITRPIRHSRIWKLLRRTILRSPFRGYFIDSWNELRQVTWPNRATAWRLTLVVVIFSAVFAGTLAALDYGLENVAKRIFLQ